MADVSHVIMFDLIAVSECGVCATKCGDQNSSARTDVTATASWFILSSLLDSRTVVPRNNHLSHIDGFTNMVALS